MAPRKPVEIEDEEEAQRNTVFINKETVTNVTSTDFPGHYYDPKEDFTWDRSAFRERLSIRFHYIHKSERECSFSLVGVDASIANAFRRILIAEIPTLAIETVFINNNTSVIQDEVLSHRLGLIPFKGGHEGLFDFMKWYHKPTAGEDPEEGSFDSNTVVVELDVECTRNEDAAPDETDPKKLFHNAHVYAKDLKFVPTGRQEQFFAGEDAIQPVHPDILIAKLRPGQAISLACHLHKGVGADHAKFSPVATASYRLLPTITITKPILGDDAAKFQACFPEGVIALEEVTRRDAAGRGNPLQGHVGEKLAVVRDTMRDTVSRECLRHPEFEGKVKLGRRRDHFIFSVESTGQWESDELFLEAVNTLREKCRRLEGHVTRMTR